MINAVFHPAAVLKEEHRLHVLCLLVNGGKVVCKHIVTDERLHAHIFPCVVAPQGFPCGGEGFFGIVHAVAELHHEIEVIRHLTAHCQILLQLVIVYHALEIPGPCRITRAFEAEFRHP